MNIVINIILALFWGAACCWLIYSAKQANVKDLDEFRKAHFLKKINLIFTQEEEDLFNNEKHRGILALIVCFVLMVHFIVSVFKESL